MTHRHSYKNNKLLTMKSNYANVVTFWLTFLDSSFYSHEINSKKARHDDHLTSILMWNDYGKFLIEYNCVCVSSEIDICTFLHNNPQSNFFYRLTSHESKATDDDQPRNKRFIKNI